jgi:hypothetical protein
MDDIRDIIAEKRGVITAGTALTLALSIYFIAWHWTIITFGSIYSVRDVSEGFLRLTASYLVASANM